MKARYYIGKPKCVEFMCRAFEEVREQGRKQGREQMQLESIKNLILNLNSRPSRLWMHWAFLSEIVKSYW